jgi:hypothetical protein
MDGSSLVLVSSWASIIGFPIGVIGIFLTVRYSYKASRASEAAKQSSESTRRSIGHIDSLSNLEEGRRLLSDIQRRIEVQNWEIVAERCASIREIVAVVQSVGGADISQESTASLSVLGAQMRSLGGMADSVRLNGRNPDVLRIRRVLSDQSEALAKVVAEFRTKIGDRGHA